MFAIISKKKPANRDSVCIIDKKAISKGDDVVLLGNKVKGQRIREWEVACIAPTCANKVEKWIATQPETATAATTTSTAAAGSSIDEAFRLVAAGNKQRDDWQEGFTKLVGSQQRIISELMKRLTALEGVVQFPESSPSNPPRPAADADNKPVNCLGIKTNGEACKQTQNRLQPNGFCGQHQGQSGDSERAGLDNHADEVKAAAVDDRPAVSKDTLELLG